MKFSKLLIDTLTLPEGVSELTAEAEWGSERTVSFGFGWEGIYLDLEGCKTLKMWAKIIDKFKQLLRSYSPNKVLSHKKKNLGIGGLGGNLQERKQKYWEEI